MILFSQQETPNWLSTYASFNLPVYTLSPLPLSSSYFTLFTFLFIFPPTLFGPSVTFQSDLSFLPFPIISVVLRFYTPPQLSRHFSFTCQPTPSLLLHKNQIHWKRGGKIVRYSFKINLFRGVQFSIGTRISTRD